MQKLLEQLRGSFDESARLIKGEIRINRKEPTTPNFTYLGSLCAINQVDLKVKRSGTGLVLIFKDRSVKFTDEKY